MSILATMLVELFNSQFYVWFSKDFFAAFALLWNALTQKL